MLDVLLVVPMSAEEAVWLDPSTRTTTTATVYGPLGRARTELELYLGRPLAFREPYGPVFSGERVVIRSDRSLTAIALADQLERAGLRWQAVDPHSRSLAEWRVILERYASSRPRVVAISSTYGAIGLWFAAFCTLVRRTFPEATIVVGGAYYATNAEAFLSFDADVFCIGEGELRLPAIVRAVRDGTPLDEILGLYLRRGDSLQFTGVAEPLKLAELPVPDWRLSMRMDPPVDADREHLWYHLETVRGCYFRCQFCTYTTLARYDQLAAAVRAQRILEMSKFGRGVLFLTDATASYPVPEWRQTLELVISAGGSKLPIGAFTRLPDLDDETVALMARANVRWAMIGLDSGDQGVLNAMKKGTSIGQIAPAMAALARHGVGAFVFGIFGFPGETPESAAATRDLLVGVNDGHEADPPAFVYDTGPWNYQDLAPVAQRSSFDAPPTRWAAERVLETYLAASRVRHAPVCFLTPGVWKLVTSDPRFLIAPARFEMHRWLKAIERGIAIFVERELAGTPPDDRELRAVRHEILAHLGYAPGSAYDRWARARKRARAALTRRLQAEWLVESARSIGPLTRSLLGVTYARAFADLQAAVRVGLAGAWPSHAHPAAVERSESLENAKRELLTVERVRNSRRAKKRDPDAEPLKASRADAE
jgi:hypothetical protein